MRSVAATIELTPTWDDRAAGGALTGFIPQHWS